MIYFDVTKSASAEHQSGLVRVSARLRAELGARVVPVRWNKGRWAGMSGAALAFSEGDWILTPELFCEEERDGFWEFLRTKTCRAAAIFHDAIPLKHPAMTWPKSVGRHPEYMKMLASFDRVFAVSRSSAAELEGFWRWQGVQAKQTVLPIELGADLRPGMKRISRADTVNTDAASPHFVSVGIVEPRKNQAFLADVAEAMARKGSAAQFHFFGRVNPIFGAPIARRLKRISKELRTVHFHEGVSDEELLALWRTARATLFPTRAEGCGLPLLESLWLGVPCVCSDLPVLRENADAGGCVPVTTDSVEAWVGVLERLISDRPWSIRLREEAMQRKLPTWQETANLLLQHLGSSSQS